MLYKSCLSLLIGATAFLSASTYALVPTESNAQIPTPGMVTLLDVSSHYCIPCRAMKPRMESLSKRFDETGLAKVFLVDMEDDPAIIDRFQIEVTPTFLFFDAEGKEVARLRGIVEEAELAHLLQKLRSEKEKSEVTKDQFKIPNLQFNVTSIFVHIFKVFLYI